MTAASSTRTGSARPPPRPRRPPSGPAAAGPPPGAGRGMSPRSAWRAARQTSVLPVTVPCGEIVRLPSAEAGEKIFVPDHDGVPGDVIGLRGRAEHGPSLGRRGVVAGGGPAEDQEISVSPRWIVTGGLRLPGLPCEPPGNPAYRPDLDAAVARQRGGARLAVGGHDIAEVPGGQPVGELLGRRGGGGLGQVGPEGRP